jgi:hypothetical protein
MLSSSTWVIRWRYGLLAISNSSSSSSSSSSLINDLAEATTNKQTNPSLFCEQFELLRIRLVFFFLLSSILFSGENVAI